MINTGMPLWGFQGRLLGRILGWVVGSQKVPGMSLTDSHTLTHPHKLLQMQIDVERNFEVDIDQTLYRWIVI